MNIFMQGLKALADLLLLYIQSLMLYPIQFWIGVGLTALGLYLIRRLFDYWFWIISGRINQHPGQERLYQVLWRFRDARDNLGEAIGELVYVAGHYVPMMIGKIMVPRWVPPDYPDPNDAKALLKSAIDLIDEKKIDLSHIKGIQDRLPDVPDITQYKGRNVDNTTFSNERVTINNVLMLVKAEIHELELRLPPFLILWEKFVLRMRVVFMFLLGIVAFFAALSLAMQIILGGMKLLINS